MMDEAVQVIVDTLDEAECAASPVNNAGDREARWHFVECNRCSGLGNNRETKVIQKTAELDKQRLLAVGRYLVQRGMSRRRQALFA